MSSLEGISLLKQIVIILPSIKQDDFGPFFPFTILQTRRNRHQKGDQKESDIGPEQEIPTLPSSQLGVESHVHQSVAR